MDKNIMAITFFIQSCRQIICTHVARKTTTEVSSKEFREFADQYTTGVSKLSSSTSHYPTHFSCLGTRRNLLLLGPLAVSLGGIVAALNDEVLGLVVVLAGEVALEDVLGAEGVALLGVDRGAGHVGDHGVTAAEGVLGVPKDVVLGRGLGEPDVAAVAAEVAGLEGVGDVLLDDDGAAGGVDEP
jgi:hypothetical protein